MVKKPNLDNTVKKVEDLSGKINIIVQNKLIIAIFLIVDGITFILNPDTTLGEMARNIILLVLLAAFSIFITNLASKTKDTKTILISLVILILGIIFYIYPDIISAYIQLLLSLFIIYDGLTNIANTLNLSKLSRFTEGIAKKIRKVTSSKKSDEEANESKAARNEKFKDIDKNINEGLEEQKAKLISPLKNIVNKTSKYSKLFIVANVISVILGIILLIFPDVSMMIWGLIFLYTGIPNLLVSIKTMDLKKKLKERKFKEILFDAEKKEEQKEQEGEEQKARQKGEKQKTQKKSKEQQKKQNGSKQTRK